MKLIDMSIAGTILIIAGVLIRKAVVDYLPKKVFLFIWWLAGIRLTVPYAIPFPVNIYTAVNHLFSVGSGGVQTQTISTAHMWQPEAGPVSAALAEPGISLSMVWQLGMILCMCYFTVVYLKCCWRFSGFAPVDNEYTREWLSKHRLLRKIRIGCSENISSPMTYGVFHPVILVPAGTDWREQGTLGYILQHEYIHIRHFDTLTKIIFTAILCIHWFNPFVWLMYVLVSRDLELICDETLVKSRGDSEKTSYALCLINMEESKNTGLSIYNNFNKNATEERIGAIMKFKNKTALTWIFSGMFMLGVTVVFGTSAQADITPGKFYAGEYDINSVDYEGQMPDGSLDEGDLHADYEELYNKLYGEYGLSYHPTDDRLYYEGKLVGYFIDNIYDEPGKFSGRLWTNTTGDVNIKVVRDANKKITGLSQISLDEAERLSGNNYRGADADFAGYSGDCALD